MSRFARLHSAGLWWHSGDTWMTEDRYSVQRLSDGRWECWTFGTMGAFPFVLDDEYIDGQIEDVWLVDIEKGWTQ